ncbi:autotransporter outer membrane beta-barrel domain-containing protein [Bartonella rattimassiliensis]|uniref:Outer membrane autotransporter barrel domain-containing protein n=1 Tax=Bartonella rattimassiliensis 15908 TaxID=1094556 RepID=J1JK09_9HYPH|nr:autotransporter outer membrane beta-barrel domain-containing protein [Bartonella rattimassiliensis]EJF84987.1 outer membrane autotransporter barrel domain-containing protein [Bartonella rattimassiliensis 15908]
MHRNLLLCTAACALFFSSNFTSTSIASSLSPETRRTLEEIIKLPQQYRHAIDLVSTPTQAEKNLEEIASGTMRQDNSQVDKILDEVEGRINSYFSGIGRNGSSAHREELQKARDNIHAQVMANNTQHMIQANAYLDRLRQERMITKENLLRGYEKAVSDAAKAAAILDADNQQRINAKRQQWTTQDNRDWYNLQNKAEILHKAAQVDSALQGQNKELANTLRKAVLDALNSDGRTNVEKKGDSIAFKEDQHSIIDSNTKQRHAGNVVSQRKSNLSTRADREIIQPKVNENAKADNTDTQNSSRPTDEKATATSTSLNVVEKRTAHPSQAESYLVMPTAMFAVGLADVNNQNILLDNMQITMFEPKDSQERGVFLSTYGNKSTFYSNLQSSIRADIRYTALQAGVTLVALKDQNINTNFGFFGTYGNLSFAPKNKEISHTNVLDKWSLTAYGNIQHDSGVYASAFLSCGIFKENITKNNIRYTLKVNNKTILGAAATVGQKLSTGWEGVILEPQAQLVYQRLMLGSFSNDGSVPNGDNSKINIGYPHQWVFRVGGRLTQNKGRAVSFYGKLNLVKAFSKNFEPDAMGSLIEGGFGIHTHLSKNIELYSDLSYQHKFEKVGITGINLSGGMRYRF